MTTVLVLSGPNLDLLGQREPEIYGTATLTDHVESFRTAASAHGWAVEHLQANAEGPIIDRIHAARRSADAIVINAASLTHSAWGIHDALATFDGPVIEVHISNPIGREAWRHMSVVSPVATGIISGFGGHSYVLAAAALVPLLQEHP